MPNPIGDPGHGDSPAAWTNIIIMLIGLSIGTVALFFWMIWLVWVGVAITVLGPIVGLIMSKLGFGVNGPKYQPKGH
ncbi:HGxxPAAW family protein [Microbacterium sp. G2-8]|uniref:HGxxPAAW family protein n=1 Tax=Microbacterium sp. G2-8 TaxID=2842454 RepID=UPI001C89F1E2|nr:HGxxPAAW family protein [Microbacterium sp. G2-8]